jgi:hypothetical protein
MLEAAESVRRCHLGEASLLAYRQDEALEFARTGLTIARERGHRGYEAGALRLLGEIAFHCDPPRIESADDQYRQAMSLATELGMRPLVAHCYLGPGKLSRRTGIFWWRCPRHTDSPGASPSPASTAEPDVSPV